MEMPNWESPPVTRDEIEIAILKSQLDTATDALIRIKSFTGNAIAKKALADIEKIASGDKTDEEIAYLQKRLG